MKTQGTLKESYLAIARPSGRAGPRDTELYGRFQTQDDAKDEQRVRGGRIVSVTETTTWKLAEEPEPSKKNS